MFKRVAQADVVAGGEAQVRAGLDHGDLGKGSATFAGV